MKTLLRSAAASVLVLLLAGPVAIAQERHTYSRAQLDQMLAPVALYPDALLSQVLMAATYPLEVVQAARWSRANPGFEGQDAVNAVEPMDWDPSVKSLVAFPQVLAMMDERIDWTQQLGEAFLAQQPEMMDAVQGLRQRAAEAGSLRSGEQFSVAERDGAYVIAPARPDVVYVPYYDPAVVYGTWWWPAYPPYYWHPPAHYYVGTGYYPGFYWSSGIRISVGFFFGAFDWHRHHVHVATHRYHAPAGTRIVPTSGRHLWQHDYRHRRGVPYRHAELRRDFGGTGARRFADRSDFRRRGDTASARFTDGNRTGDTTVRRDGRWSGGARQATREATSAPAPGVQGGSPLNFDGATRRSAITDSTAVARPAPQAVRPGREARRMQEPPRGRQSTPRAANPRAPETRAAPQAPRVRARSNPEPRARSAHDAGPRSARGAQHFNAATRSAGPAPVPRAERAAPRARENTRFQGRGRDRPDTGRSRDRRS